MISSQRTWARSEESGKLSKMGRSNHLVTVEGSFQFPSVCLSFDDEGKQEQDLQYLYTAKIQ